MGSSGLANQKVDWKNMFEFLPTTIKKKEKKVRTKAELQIKADICKLEISNKILTGRAISLWNNLPRKVMDYSPQSFLKDFFFPVNSV